MVDIGHICCKAVIGTKNCCIERYLSENHMLSFLQTIGTLLLFWMEICLANSASGSTVSFLPVPEEGLGSP